MKTNIKSAILSMTITLFGAMAIAQQKPFLNDPIAISHYAVQVANENRGLNT